MWNKCEWWMQRSRCRMPTGFRSNNPSVKYILEGMSCEISIYPTANPYYGPLVHASIWCGHTKPHMRVMNILTSYGSMGSRSRSRTNWTNHKAIINSCVDTKQESKLVYLQETNIFWEHKTLSCKEKVDDNKKQFIQLARNWALSHYYNSAELVMVLARLYLYLSRLHQNWS